MSRFSTAIFPTTIFNDSSILITIISCDYLNLSLSNEYADDVTIPTQVIKYSNNFLQADQPIRLQFWNQIIGHYRNKPENSYQCNTALKLILKNQKY
jgi:hypothetical protein